MRRFGLERPRRSLRPNLRDSLFTEFFNPQSFRHDVSITSRRTDDDSRFCSSVVKFFIHNLSFYEMEIAAALKGNHLLHGFALFFSNQMVFVFVLNFWKGQFSISSETKLHPVYLSNLTLQLSPCTTKTQYYLPNITHFWRQNSNFLFDINCNNNGSLLSAKVKIKPIL